MNRFWAALLTWLGVYIAFFLFAELASLVIHLAVKPILITSAVLATIASLFVYAAIGAKQQVVSPQ